MDDDKKAILARELERLRGDYVNNLVERVAAIGEAMDQVAHGAGGIVSGLETIRFEAHKAAGSGAMFGFGDVSEAARELEQRAGTLLDFDGKPGPAERAVLAGLVDRLKIVSRKVQSNPEPIVESKAVAAVDVVKPVRDRHILLVDSEASFGKEMAAGLSSFGVSVRRAQSIGDVEAAVAGHMPSAVLISLSEADREKLGGLKAVREVLSCPLVVLSECRDLETRLAAVRAGVDSYLFKPVAVGQIIDTLDRLMATEDMEPYRVMILDDDPALGGYVDVALRGAGMITTVGTDPMEALDRLEEFAPELILLDLNMPGCGGEELASVIRQQESLAGVSIVFLSGETDLNRRLEALRCGADDFLSKPIQADDLIAAVRTRVHRFRLLRNLMVRDSMTGLLNHSSFWEALENETARGRRSGGPASVAVLDIDHFKGVNDTHGHGVGDAVIKSLARLLRQVVRQTDHVGRLGGEEFGIVLAGIDSQGAAAICERIRTSFAEIRQLSEHGEFSVTLSCGVAGFPGFASARDVYNAADEALYSAKRGGRNRVVVAE